MLSIFQFEVQKKAILLCLLTFLSSAAFGTAPVAINTSIEVPQADSYTGTIEAYDRDSNSLNIQLRRDSNGNPINPTHGTLIFGQVTYQALSVGKLTKKEFTYSPEPGYSGPDEILISASDATLSSLGRVGISVLTPDQRVITQIRQFISVDSITPLGSNIFFVANDGIHGEELWKSDGTEAGTVLVRDIVSGSYGSSPDALTVVGNTLFFVANDGVVGSELWKSDGTEAGTVLVKDIFPGANEPPTPTVDVYVHRYIGGSNEGERIGRLNDKSRKYPESSGPRSLTAVGNTLFFSANDGGVGEELWKSDGTSAGTVLVKDINTGRTESVYSGEPGEICSSSPAYFVEFNGKLFFSAYTKAAGYELWRSDGTSSGTQLVKNIDTASFTPFRSSVRKPYSSAIAKKVVFNNRIFFAASTYSKGRELWKSDGTSAGTVLVKDIEPRVNNNYTPPLGNGSYPDNLTVVGSTLFFSAFTFAQHNELWKSDGSAGGTVLVKDILPGNSYYGSTPTGGSNPSRMININGTLFFVASNGTNGYELFRSDGTEGGTLMVKDLAVADSSFAINAYINAPSANPLSLKVVGNSLYLAITNGAGTWLAKF